MILLTVLSAFATPPAMGRGACPDLTFDIDLPLADWTREASSVLEVDSRCTGITCQFVVTRVLKGDAAPGDTMSHGVYQGTPNTTANTGRLLVWGDILDTTQPDDAVQSREFRLLDPRIGTVLRHGTTSGFDSAWYGSAGPVTPLPGGIERFGVSCHSLHALTEYGRQFDLAFFGGAVPADAPAVNEARARLTQLMTSALSWNHLLDRLAPATVVAP